MVCLSCVCKKHTPWIEQPPCWSSFYSIGIWKVYIWNEMLLVFCWVTVKTCHVYQYRYQILSMNHIHLQLKVWYTRIRWKYCVVFEGTPATAHYMQPPLQTAVANCKSVSWKTYMACNCWDSLLSISKYCIQKLAVLMVMLKPNLLNCFTIHSCTDYIPI